MEKRDRARFVQGMAQLAEIFQHELSEQQIKIYLHVLKDLDIDALCHAISVIVRNGRRFPLPIELREHAGEYMRQKRETALKIDRNREGMIPVEELQKLVSGLVQQLDQNTEAKKIPRRYDEDFVIDLNSDEIKRRKAELKRQAQEIMAG